MTKVFIGGSRRFSRLNPEIRKRLDRMVEKGLSIAVGDANGADKAVQAYLHERAHALVEVFAADESPRNNVGRWPVRVVRTEGTSRGFDHFAAKDRVMAREATVGLMLWDGESRGTLLNVLRLVAEAKTVVVYVGPRREFVDVRERSQLDALLSIASRDAARRFHDQAAREGLESAQASLRLP